MTETEIPADIIATAKKTADHYWRDLDPVKASHLKLDIARALLAERRRHTVEAGAVTPAMVDAGLRITLSSVGLPAGECLHATDVLEVVTAALSAAPTPPSRAEVTAEWQPMSTAPTEDGTIIEVARIPDVERWNAARFLRLKADCLDLFQWRPALGAGKKEAGHEW